MDISNAKVVVTGAGGFIGSHLVELLASRGCDVTAMLRYNSQGSVGWLQMLSDQQRKRIKIVHGDIRDPWSVLGITKDAEVIFHLAALISIPYSYEAPDAYVETNVRGTLNVLNATRQHGTKKIVVTSTSEVYGTAQTVPMTEEHPLQSQSPYSATKTGGDQIALSFYRSFDTPVTVLRPFNCFGPRQSTRAIIPTIISQIKTGSKVIRVGALKPTRDFTFVEDSARAFVSAAESEKSTGEVINAGSSTEVSIGDLIAKIQGICGSNCKVEVEDERLRPEKSEVYRLFSDSSKAQRLIGWKPSLSLDEGLKRTVEWFSQPANLAFYPERGYRV